MTDRDWSDFAPNDRLSGRDTKSVPSQRTPSTGNVPNITKRGYLLRPDTGSTDGYVQGPDGKFTRVDEFKPVR